MAILDYAWSLVPGDRSGALRTCVIPNKQQQQPPGRGKYLELGRIGGLESWLTGLDG